ncbi:O-antigen ligase family protein [Halolamina salifodinae]|uniref:O-antigen ligase-related domain-containing protein n=1 Tax=Halolamina salifodinae TaxID=1202767 RepID=A0A8T4H3N5_9EURY|nr:O-antigen ligase family protein [Halolamina salifodinae]MBP1987798.1 hypothetical protein [Halolamina salifodinae]
MDLYSRIEFLPRIETDYSDHREALLIATGLIVGLTFLAPTLSIVLGVPALVFVIAIGGIYGVLILLLRRLLVGLIIGLVVTSPFAANVPLAGEAYLKSFPGHLGPELWLVQVPLVLSAVLVLATGPRKLLAGATRTEGLFTVFVGWTVVAAVFGATARLDTALYFSLLMAQALAAFILLRYTVQQRILSFRTVVEVFVGTVLAQSLLAVTQFIHGANLGVTTLGESDSIPLSTLSFGPFGEFTTGTYVAGFTGMSFILASLVILAAPMVMMIAVRVNGIRRAGLLMSTLIMIGVLRATGSDAARGGLIIALLLLGVLYLYASREAIREKISITGTRVLFNIRNNIKYFIYRIGITVATVVVLFYPSSASGSSSAITNVDPETESGASSTSETTAMNNTSSTAGTPQDMEKLLGDLSVPHFDLANLGVRLRQYVGGLDLFLQHPVFGIGGANYVYYATQYDPSRPYPLHNIYIGLLAETGFIGFLLYIVVLGSVLWYTWKIVGSSNSDALLFLGIFCGMLGYLAFGFWDHLPLTRVTSLIPFWLLAGTVVGEYMKIKKNNTASNTH